MKMNERKTEREEEKIIIKAAECRSLYYMSRS